LTTLDERTKGVYFTDTKKQTKPEAFAESMDEYMTFLLGGEDLSPELKKELAEFDANRER
jgi:hypothetical protein